MPAVRFDNGGYLKEILQSLTIETPVNWWITDLVCYDYCGWPGCEKWSETELFLTDEQFKHDVYTRNSQMVWGVFSAIPAIYTQEEIEAYSHPFADGYWPKEMPILPQHPLAVAEILSFDSSEVLVSSNDRSLLLPLFSLPNSIDEEVEVEKTNRELTHIRGVIGRLYPGIGELMINEIQWDCWRLFREHEERVSDDALQDAVHKAYQAVKTPGYPYRRT